MSDLGQATITEFKVGKVLGRGIGLFFGNFGRFLPVILASSLPLVIVLILFPSQDAAFNESSDVSVDFNVDFENLGGFIGWLVSMVTYCWLSAGITYGVVSCLRGRKPDGTEVLVRSLRSVPRLLLLMLVVSVGSFLVMIPAVILMLIPFVGFVFAFVLFFWLLVLFWVTLAAAVVEGLGPFAALRRSVELSKGSRWSILGVILLLFLVLFAVMFVLLLVTMGIGAAAGMTGSSSIVGAIIFALLQALMMGLGASVAAVGYHDLRVTREGVGTEQIAQVFD